MLEVLYRFFSAIIISFTAAYIIRKMIGKQDEKLNLKNFILILILSILVSLVHQLEYTALSTLVIFLLDIVVFKIIYKLLLEESIISTSIYMLMLALCDALSSFIFMPIFSVQEIRTNSVTMIISNITVNLILVILMNIKCIKNSLTKFYNTGIKNRAFPNILFFVLLIVGFCYLAYNIAISSFFNKEYILNILVMIIFTIVMYIFVDNQNKYKKLEEDYDNLFQYVQNFEDWIEKEQMNRHEYKNQLAVLRCLTKEKKVKNKIDEILEDNINIENQAVTNLRKLPKGGIKGLMYYKSALAQKQKIHLATDVSINEKGILSKLSEKDIRVLCKLIGIYFDNAIEAASESKRKNIMIEVYELNDKVSFVFSNTFKKHKNMKARNKKGVSSKGEGRGNGLYFAAKLIKENPWIEERQDIIDNYYIQQISVKKNTIKKESNL